jgi:hypothetical protein
LRLAPLILQFHIVILVLHLDLIKSFHFHYSVILASKYINMFFEYYLLTHIVTLLHYYWNYSNFGFDDFGCC